MSGRGLVSVAVAAVLAGPGAAAQERPPNLAVIVHPEAPPKSLTALQLNAIFTSSQKSWPGGSSIVAFAYPNENRLRVEFDRVVLGLTPDQVGRFWIDQRIRGGARPPRQVPDPALALRLVASLRGSIGYVPAAMASPAVRVVARIVDGKVLPP